ADQRGYSSVRLSYKVEPGIMCQRTSLSERRNRAHDDPWIDCADGLVVETHTADDAGGEIFNHHVEFGYQLLDQFDRGGLLHIQAKALLATILLDEVGAALVADELNFAGLVTFRCEFNLDDFRSHP